MNITRVATDEGVRIVDARWGSDGRRVAVIDRVKSLLTKDGVDLDVKAAVLSDVPMHGPTQLRLTIDIHQARLMLRLPENSHLTLKNIPLEKTVEAVASAAAPPAPADTGNLKVIEARWGTLIRKADVTELLRKKLSGGRLEITASAELLGDPAPGSDKMLTITYELDGKRETAQFKQNEGISLGSLRPEWEQRIAQMGKADPGALVVLAARWGNERSWGDIRDLCQGLVLGDSLTVPVKAEAFGEKNGAGTRLEITYFDGKRVSREVVNDGATLQIGSQQTSVVRPGKTIESVKSVLEEIRKTQPTGIAVICATWGNDRWRKDETEVCRSVVSGDSLTVPVSGQAFGEKDDEWTDLKILYQDGKELKSETIKHGATLQVGKKITSFLKLEGGLKNMDATVAEMRKSRPTGPLVLEAVWWRDNAKKDVTDICQGAAWGDSLTIPLKKAAFGPGAYDWSHLRIMYVDGKEIKTAVLDENQVFQVGPRITSYPSKDGLVYIEKQVGELRAKYGEGLIVLQAEYGVDNTWVDVRELLQSMSREGQVHTRVGVQGWPNPVPNADKQVHVIYWDGTTVRTADAKDKEALVLSGAGSGVLMKLAVLPKFIPAGSPMKHHFGVPGSYTLKSGPAGATLSANGDLSWNPGDSQVGLQEFRISIQAAGKEYNDVQSCEVVSREVLRSLGGDVKKLESLLRLELSGDEHQYVVDAHFGGAIILQKDQLTAVAADGISVVRKVHLEHPYVRIAEREQYYVGVRLEPMMLDLIDKKSGGVIRTIKLQYPAFRDLVLLPNEPFSFVSVRNAQSVPHDRIVVVDEKRGEVREPKDLIGTFMKVDRSGRHMWVGIKDLYRQGTEYFINPDWNIVTTPRYGTIDFLLRFDIVNGELVRKESIENVGANGSGVRVSADGKRVTYLSFTGFPGFSKNIAAWDGTDFRKKPVVYEIKDQTGGKEPTSIDFHPVLPLVVIPKESGAMVFGRETGDEEKDRIKIPPGLLDTAAVTDARFSPDGLSVILSCRKGEENFLYRLPLILREEERAVIKRGAPPEPREVPRVKPALQDGSNRQGA
jgi:hypothetical protein